MSPIEITDARRTAVDPVACGRLWGEYSPEDRALLDSLHTPIYRVGVHLRGASLTAAQLAERIGWSLGYTRKVLRACRHFGYVEQATRNTYTWRVPAAKVAA